MTDENRSPPGRPGQRRKRPPTVLDLEATDVTPEGAAAPQQPAESGPTSADAPPARPPEASAESPTEPGASASASAEPPPAHSAPEPPVPEPTQSEEPAAETSSAQPARGAGWVPDGAAWTHVGAGIAGATGGILVFLLLWAGGVLPGVRDSSADLRPELAAIQSQIKTVSNRPAPASVDPKVLDALGARLAKLEAAQSQPSKPATDPALISRLGAIESAMKSLTDRTTALTQRIDGQDSAMREANARIEKLTASLAEMQTALRQAQAGSDRAARLATAAAMLRSAVERSEPFASELAIVKPLAADGADVAALEPFAASGVPSDAALGRELAATVEPMLSKKSPEPASGGGFLDRLQANAEKIVRIQRVDEPRGDDQSTVLARLKQRADRSDVVAALAELNKLSADARAPFQSWIAKANARGNAIEASRRLAAGAIAALKPAP